MAAHRHENLGLSDFHDTCEVFVQNYSSTIHNLRQSLKRTRLLIKTEFLSKENNEYLAKFYPID